MPAPRMGFVQDNLTADSSGYQLRMLGPVMVLYGGTSLVTSLDLRALEANLGAKVIFRTFDVTAELPNAWDTATGTARTANGAWPESLDVSAKTAQMLIQGSVFTNLTTGTAAKAVQARLWTQVRGAGWMVARQRIVLTPGTNIIVPVGNPFACSGVTGLMFGFVFNGVGGTIANPSCVWRSFDSGDPRQPGAWSSSLATLTNVTTDVTVNSGNCAITTTDKIMAQPGFQYSTSGTNPNGTVDIIVAAKK